MIRQVKTTLRCSWCLSEAPTLITYMGDSIVKMECQSCGHIYRISKASLYSSILSQWETRALTKPLRLAKEIKNHPSRFVLSFPFRVLTKPLRVTKELAQTYIKSWKSIGKRLDNLEITLKPVWSSKHHHSSHLNTIKISLKQVGSFLIKEEKLEIRAGKEAMKGR